MHERQTVVACLFTAQGLVQDLLDRGLERGLDVRVDELLAHGLGLREPCDALRAGVRLVHVAGLINSDDRRVRCLDELEQLEGGVLHLLLRGLGSRHIVRDTEASRDLAVDTTPCGGVHEKFASVAILGPVECACA